jgi:transketolase
MSIDISNDRVGPGSEELRLEARELRASVVRMVSGSKSSHVGSALSIVDILCVLYNRILRIEPANPLDPARDRFVLSKGHGGAALYAVLAHRGFFCRSELASYCRDGSRLAGHPMLQSRPGVEATTGSLGHGLPMGVGMAMAARLDGLDSRVFVVVGDGECNEGSVWEAALVAAHHKLSSLTVIVDYNKQQGLGRIEQVQGLEPLADKWRAFGFGVAEVDGHDLAALETVLRRGPLESGRPTALIAHTIKGKGVGFMEDQIKWHYSSPGPDELRQALEALGVGPEVAE